MANIKTMVRLGEGEKNENEGRKKKVKQEMTKVSCKMGGKINKSIQRILIQEAAKVRR